MKSLKQHWDRVPEGSAVLFMVQMFATLGFAVLQSTLVLYATHRLGFSSEQAALMMGLFGAFNYGLHLFGGYLGGRFLSNRNLFVGGMLLQVLGCGAIAGGTLAGLYWGMALFLTGSGLNVTCLNMMLTQRFAPEDDRREGAFLWNYAGMNVGFFVGFTVAGHFQLDERYGSLFWFATVGNAMAILLALVFWRTLADRDTPLSQRRGTDFWGRFAVGVAVLTGLVPLLAWLLQHPGDTAIGMKALCGAVGVALLVLTLRHPVPAEKRRMQAYLVLTLGSLVFWSLYQMAPSGLQLYAVGNVWLNVWGVTVAPQWVQNINTVVIVIGGPWLAAVFARWRTKGWPVDIPMQFSASLVLMGLGFLALPLGIQLADPASGRADFFWLFLSYVLQSIGELLISPVGYAMIGRIAPRQYQGIMMGSWMLVTGLASLFAGDFSGVVAQPVDGSALATNPAYATLFTQLAVGSLATGALMFTLRPWLRRLIDSA
ncbi:peptide MFS transporter [Roseateles saccharophilus]|uniref:POT family proton-dependent oligopeptide transporter n=1 Tax=Roseateles saccharophilus TaxID=304 RepID=A0A4R3VBU4_ROSSA|nr:oligopeptide:H+ symporter [Roseateles saccharophilus]MDG0831719.1 MFS transporter [Roseateles saccharophilus]TCV01263.1 POT family proton-dependent oligopeptide transporter [Roseateles saccharophilus]